jgi:Zn-dependent M28 family amino/carboxypeptidase
MKGKLYLIFILVSFFCSCESSKKTPEKITKKNPWKTLTVPSFNSDSAYNFIAKQVAFGPRVPNTIGHQRCGDYLINKLRSYGAKVTVQEFSEVAYNGQVLRLRNIIGSFNPTTKKRILLAAHWDTRPFADKDVENRDMPIEGANDGASGVAVLLEIARVIHDNENPRSGLDIIFFDGEDYGEHEDVETPPLKNNRMQIWWCLGSQYWSKRPHIPNYSAYYGILLDMVGGKNAKFYKEGGSMQFAPKVNKKVWNTARSLGYSNYFVNALSPGVTDDHIFVNRDARIPMINIIDFDPASPSYYFPDYHHTHRDNLDLIDKQTLQAVGETMMYLIYTE